YRQLDNLAVVAKDPGTKAPGQLVYYGPAYPQAVQFFNPKKKPSEDLSPDEVLRGLAKDKSAEWVQRYAASPWKRQFVDERAGKKLPLAGDAPALQRPLRILGLHQWWILLRRT